MNQQRVTDEMLHAYVDGELEESDARQVEEHLAQDGEAARKVDHIRQLNQSLHQVFDRTLNEPIPERLLPVHRRRSHFVPWAASMLVVAGLSGYLGWQWRGTVMPVPEANIYVDLVKPAAFAHVIYTPEYRHAVDVPADEEEYLVRWLSRRLHTTVQAPNLSKVGFRLVGGRLLPSTNRMAAQFMYESEEGQRMTLYIRRNDWKKRETAFRFSADRGLRVLYWVDGDLGYALTAELEKGAMTRVADAVRADLLMRMHMPKVEKEGV